MEIIYPQFNPSHGGMTTRNSFAPNDNAWFIVDIEKRTNNSYFISNIP